MIDALRFKNKKKGIIVLFGILTLLVSPIFSGPSDIPQTAWLTGVLAIVMAVFWATESLPLSFTSLLPLIALPMYEVSDFHAVLMSSFSPGLLVFFGGFIASTAISHNKLHIHLVNGMSNKLGSSSVGILFGLMLATACISMLMSNTTAALVMLPIAMAVGASVTIDGENNKNDLPAALLVLGIAHAATIGGMVTLVGTPPNVLTAEFLRETHSLDIGFAKWLLFSLPIAVLLFLVSWLMLSFFLRRTGCKFTPNNSTANESLSSDQKTVLFLIFLLLIGWITRPIVNKIIPFNYWNDVVISILVVCSFWLMPSRDRDKERLVPVKLVLTFPMPVLFLFGGGLMLAQGFEASGLTTWIAKATNILDSVPSWVVVFGFVLMVSLLTEFMSNTASTAMLLPVAAAVAEGAALSPALLAFCVCFAANAAFILPVATAPNTIAFMSGAVKSSQMMRFGLLLNIVGVCLISLIFPQLVEIFIKT